MYISDFQAKFLTQGFASEPTILRFLHSPRSESSKTGVSVKYARSGEKDKKVISKII